MNQLLGFITAFFVVGWAVRWYFRQSSTPRAIDWQPPTDDTVLPASTRWETLTDVRVEPTLDEPRVTIESTKTGPLDYEPADDVERRLEALVSEDDEEVLPAPALDGGNRDSSVEARAENIAASAPPDDGGASETESPEPVEETIMGFCARCRDKRAVLNPVRTQTKKGKAAMRGNCEVCGAGMFVFVSENK